MTNTSFHLYWEVVSSSLTRWQGTISGTSCHLEEYSRTRQSRHYKSPGRPCYFCYIPPALTHRTINPLWVFRGQMAPSGTQYAAQNVRIDRWLEGTGIVLSILTERQRNRSSITGKDRKACLEHSVAVGSLPHPASCPVFAGGSSPSSSAT
jgi:hypothetical protein